MRLLLCDMAYLDPQRSSPYGFCELFFLGLIRASERGNAHLSQVYPRASDGGNLPEPLMPFTAFLSLSLI